MTVPVFDPVNIADKDGALTPAWKNTLQNLFELLQSRFSDEGLVMPSQDDSSVLELTESDNGATLYNSTTNQPITNISGKWFPLTTGSITNPSRLITSTSIDVSSLNQFVLYTFINAGLNIITITITNGYFINPTVLNGTETTIGLNPQDIVTLVSVGDKSVLVE